MSDLDRIRTPAEIRAWFEANAGSVTASLVAERAVRAILGLHDEVTVIVYDDAQPVCREDGQEYDGVDLPGCRTTRAIDAELNHVLRGVGVSGENRSEPTPAPRDGDRVRLHTERGLVTGRYFLDVDDDGREMVAADRPVDGCSVFLVEINGVRRRIEVLSEAVSPEATP